MQWENTKREKKKVSISTLLLHGYARTSLHVANLAEWNKFKYLETTRVVLNFSFKQQNFHFFYTTPPAPPTHERLLGIPTHKREKLELLWVRRAGMGSLQASAEIPTRPFLSLSLCPSLKPLLLRHLWGTPGLQEYRLKASPSNERTQRVYSLDN